MSVQTLREMYSLRTNICQLSGYLRSAYLRKCFSPVQSRDCDLFSSDLTQS